MELITGNYTGSDMNNDLTVELLSGYLAGEQTVSHDNLCWVTKTHWPIESPFGATKFSAQKCISVVRNPIDMMASMALMLNTNSHSATTVVPPNEADPIWWDKFVKSVTKLLNNSVAPMNEVESTIPTYYIRYEDLVLNPEPVLMELFAFLLDVESIEGTLVEKRIKDYVAKGNKNGSVYKLKADPAKNLSRNAGMYTDAQFEFIKAECRDFLYYFSYTDHPDASLQDPNTTFFTYEKETKHDDRKLTTTFGAYKRVNTAGLA